MPFLDPCIENTCSMIHGSMYCSVFVLIATTEQPTTEDLDLEPLCTRDLFETLLIPEILGHKSR